MDYSLIPIRSPRLGPAGAIALATTAILSLGASAVAADAAPAPRVLLPFTKGVQTTVAGGEGRVVVMRSTDHGSELVEVTSSAAPRLIAKIEGDVTPFSIGTDDSGAAVAIVQPCVGLESKAVGTCELSVVNIASGATTELPTGKGALLGDLDHGRALVVRPSKRQGVAFAWSHQPNATHLTPIPLSTALGTKSATAAQVHARFANGIDYRNGVVATVIESPADVGGGSALLSYEAGGGWTSLAWSSYGEASGIPRVYRAPTVTRHDIKAFYDGGDNDKGFAARWAVTGSQVRKVSSSRFGARNIDDDATFNGNTLVTALSSDDWCADPDTSVACGVSAFGPIDLG